MTAEGQEVGRMQGVRDRGAANTQRSKLLVMRCLWLAVCVEEAARCYVQSGCACMQKDVNIGIPEW